MQQGCIKDYEIYEIPVKILDILFCMELLGKSGVATLQ